MKPSKRKYAPATRLPAQLTYTAPERILLPNGLAMYLIQAGSLDLSRISLFHRAGTKYQHKTLVASTVIAQLSEGVQLPSGLLNAQQIAEQWDYLGSIYDTLIDRDFAQQSLYSLNRQLEKSADLFFHSLCTPTFPEAALHTYQTKQRELLLQQNQRSEYQARKAYMSALFGSDSPYGHSAEPDDYLNLTTNDLQQFHRAFYGRPCLVVSGKISTKHQQFLVDLFSRLPLASPSYPGSMYDRIQPNQPRTGLSYIERKDAAQSSLRMGKLLFNKEHPDYLGMQVLSTVLGGYFGSRLMKNIREDKGYTYGIYAGLSSMEDAGMFTISAEIGSEHTEACRKEVHHELRRLQEDLIPSEELDMVRNFMIGDLLRTVDGPWNLAEVAIETLQSKQDFSFVHQVFDRLKTIEAAELRSLAQTYLEPDSMLEIIVGPPKTLHA